MKSDTEAEHGFLFAMADTSMRTQAAHHKKRAATKLLPFDHKKSEFLATASHELRTPLTIIREYTNLMVDGVTGPVTEPQIHCLLSVLRNCDRLTSLLNDLLDLAKIESGKMALRRTRLKLDVVLQECVDDFNLLLKRKSQSMVLEIEEGLPAVLGDKSKIAQALVNFIGNSTKFTPEGGQIRLKAYAKANVVHIEVIDNGPGIDQADLAGIFEAFAQLAHEDLPGAKGTGLGLNITRKIVELHDGIISIQSVKGAGSTFGFTLPVHTDAFELDAFVRDQSRTEIDESSRPTVFAVLVLSLDGEKPDEDQINCVQEAADRTFGHATCSQLLRTQGILIYVDREPPNKIKSKIEALRLALSDQTMFAKVAYTEIRPECGSKALSFVLKRLAGVSVTH